MEKVMAKNNTYKQSIRDKVIKYIQSGHSTVEAAAKYKIDRKTAWRWWDRWDTDQPSVAKPRGCKPGHHPSRKIDMAALKADFKAHRYHSYAKRAKRFGVTDVAILKAKKRMNQIQS